VHSLRFCPCYLFRNLRVGAIHLGRSQPFHCVAAECMEFLLNPGTQGRLKPINTNLLPMPRFSASTVAAAAAGAMVVALTPDQAHAITVCTPVFTPPNVAPGSPISANLGTVMPCPPPTVTVSLDTVGSGLASQATGEVFINDGITGLGTNNFTRTSITGVGIGSAANTTQPFKVSFSKTVANPYLFFTWFDPSTSFKFADPFALLQSNNASVSGDTIITTGANNQDSGFVVQMLGAYKDIDFTYTNASSTNSVSVFTAGVTPVPGPLPVVGLGIAYSMSRKLRRRIIR
jgi:hypothetical protein